MSAAPQSLLTAVGAAVAVSVELLVAMAIVLAVGVSRRWRDALIGAFRSRRLTIGTLLLRFGLEWLRRAVLRPAGAKSRSSVMKEFTEARQALEDAQLPPLGQRDFRQARLRRNIGAAAPGAPDGWRLRALLPLSVLSCWHSRSRDRCAREDAEASSFSPQSAASR